MSNRAVRALLVGITLATVLGWTQVIGGGLLWVWLAGAAFGTLVWVLPQLITRHFSDVTLWLRSRVWAREEGSLYRFGSVILRVEDDGRHVWIDAGGLMRATGRKEPDEAIAARHASHWQRDATGRLMLRVDAVVRNLSTQPGREDPTIQKLRRYLERDVLYPAAQRRARSR